jgi:hypothetical protein
MTRTIPREVSREDVGWLAGIIDGEGSITFQKPIKPQKTGLKKIVYGVHIVNSNEELIKKCLKIINAFDDGLGKMLEVKPKQYRKVMFKMNKGCHQITIRRYGTLKNVLKVITPHLTEKKIKAEKLLNFVSNRKLYSKLSEEDAIKFLNFTPVETERTTLERDEATVRTHK